MIRRTRNEQDRASHGSCTALAAIVAAIASGNRTSTMGPTDPPTSTGHGRSSERYGSHSAWAPTSTRSRFGCGRARAACEAALGRSDRHGGCAGEQNATQQDLSDHNEPWSARATVCDSVRLERARSRRWFPCRVRSVRVEDGAARGLRRRSGDPDRRVRPCPCARCARRRRHADRHPSPRVQVSLRLVPRRNSALCLRVASTDRFRSSAHPLGPASGHVTTARRSIRSCASTTRS